MDNAHLIVGLGNPGREYALTRHNSGFIALDHLAKRWRVGWTNAARFQASLAKAQVGAARVWLCKPQTFMNLSGVAVQAVVAYHRVPLSQLLVVVDDADLPLGALRMRAGGSAGGHHGLESVEQHVGSREYARLRIGIGRTAAQGREITGHVLGRFSGTDAVVLRAVLERVGDQVERWLTAGIQAAMNDFNGSINTSPLVNES